MKKLIISFMFLCSISALKANEVFVIVNEQNPVGEISVQQLQNFFLKKNREWSNGQAVRFFDRRDDSPERLIFLKDVIHKSTREVELYWIGQKLYSGNTAPIQVSTDSMMASMVSRFPGAIGYVSPGFQGAPGVKKLLIKKD
jgi:ABC-type phosphate transport system substrate-binding protein